MNHSVLFRRGAAALSTLGISIALVSGCTNGDNETPTTDAGAHEASTDANVVKDTSTPIDSADSEVDDAPAPEDTSVPDAADAAKPDSNAPDAADAASPDTSVADASVDDTSVPDTSISDTSISSDGAFATTPNLLLNGDAEGAAGSATNVVVPVPSWTSAGNATVIVYGAAGGYPLATDPGPADRGINFFCGGGSDALSTFTQHVDLTAYAPSIALGNVSYALSAYLGGYASQGDNATLSITFYDAENSDIGATSVGPVTAADRASATGLLLRTGVGTVPAATTSIDAVLTLARTDGSANDGYADDLSFTMTGN